MPTGYTAAIENGISFEEYAMNCARAFGALITMRDDPPDAKIPDEFVPSDYANKLMEDAQAKLARLRAMSDEDADAGARAAYDAVCASHAQAIGKANALRRKYSDMLRKVIDWVPPSSDHVELKKFMVSQINESIEFDCSTRYYNENKPVRMTGKEWRAKEIAAALRDIEYYSRQHREELDRVAKRSEWVRQLRTSLCGSAAK